MDVVGTTDLKMINKIPSEICINTSRCLINNLTISDVEDFILIYTDEITRKYLGGALNKSKAKEKAIHLLENQDKVYAVRDNKNDSLLGILYLNIYYDKKYIELSYEFKSNCFGMGYAYESIASFLQYLKQVGIQTIVAETQKKNTSSIKLLKKLGFSKTKELVRFGEKQIVFKKTFLEEREIWNGCRTI